jgi:murein DD-endopeptidase MepM/ murein hydrolase activator NlpD
MPPHPRWKIPLVWHGSAAVARVVEVSANLARAVITLAVLVGGLLLLLGTAEFGRRDLAERAGAGLFGTAPDTLSLLISRRPAPGVTATEAALWSLNPANLLTGSFRDASDSLAETMRRLVSTPSLMPTQGWLSSNFSRRRYHPLLHIVRPHEGIDVRAPVGTPIEAPAAGMVIKAGWDGGYGRTVEIDHGFGIVTRYAHTSKILVKPGQRVERGEVIAKVGRSGLAEASHLHYEVHVAGRPVDPLRFVLPAVFAD